MAEICTEAMASTVGYMGEACNFTPIESGIGGLLLGISVAMTLLIDGKILGISGILGPFLRAWWVDGKSASAKVFWQSLFILGLILGGIMNMLFNNTFAFPPASDFSWPRYAIAGLLVGAGTRLGGGCTSGHGLCGLARLSLRSWVGVPLFMSVAGIVVALSRHAANVDPNGKHAVAQPSWPPAWQFPVGALCTSVMLCFVVLFGKPFRAITSPFASGTIFGLGLGCSGMTSQAKVLAFLDIGGTWDPSLAFVMGLGLVVSFPANAYARTANAKPIGKGCSFEKANNTKLDWKLMVGLTCFGVGWGLTGICPGPGIAGAIPYAIQNSDQGWFYFMQLGLICVGWLMADRALIRLSPPAKPPSPLPASFSEPVLLAVCHGGQQLQEWQQVELNKLVDQIKHTYFANHDVGLVVMPEESVPQSASVVSACNQAVWKYIQLLLHNFQVGNAVLLFETTTLLPDYIRITIDVLASSLHISASPVQGLKVTSEAELQQLIENSKFSMEYLLDSLDRLLAMAKIASSSQEKDAELLFSNSEVLRLDVLAGGAKMREALVRGYAVFEEVAYDIITQMCEQSLAITVDDQEAKQHAPSILYGVLCMFMSSTITSL